MQNAIVACKSGETLTLQIQEQLQLRIRPAPAAAKPTVNPGLAAAGGAGGDAKGKGKPVYKTARESAIEDALKEQFKVLDTDGVGTAAAQGWLRTAVRLLFGWADA